MDSPDTWKITVEDRSKHNATFMQLSPVNGLHLTGEQARAFFLKSNLPTPVLGQIWNLADMNKDGKLDQREFSIACFLIKRVLTSPLGASVLPGQLPPSLLVDPTATSNVSSLSSLTMMPTAPPPQPSLFSTSSAFPPPPPSSSIIPSLIPSSGGGTPLLPPTTTSVMSSHPPAGAVFTPLAALNSTSPNPLVPIPVTSRSKYTQMFQSNDPTGSGFLSGAQAKNILLQTSLAPALLAKVWSLADFDQDGRLSLDEFVCAMHLCDYAKLGNVLPSTLPVELQPLRTRSASSVSVGNLHSTNSGLMSSSMTTGIGGGSPLPPMPLVTPSSSGQDSPPPPQATNRPLASFEDKLRENYERGNAILEAKRQALKEQEEREKREREEKERQEQERRQKIKDEQDRRRQQELERQMERQRLLDQQREEEHRKQMEQKERARNELIRQQRIEWEKQKTQEMETQRLKLQELLSTLKAKDKNLEYDMQTLNDKIAAYKSKISDSQSTLNELNGRLEETRRNFVSKQMEVEQAEKELQEYNTRLTRLGQEKLYLVEQQKNLNQDSPFAEQYRHDSTQLKTKQSNMQQLKSELENIEMQINTTRTQLEIRKHELEVTRSDEADLMKENARLEQLLDIKRGNVVVGSNGSLAATANRTVGATPSNNGYMKQSESMSSAITTTNTKNNQNIMKTSQSANSIRSNTPKDNYDALKDEIMKIHRSSVNQSPTIVSAAHQTSSPTTTTALLNNNTTSPAFDPFSSNQSAATASVAFDPFGGGVGTTTTTTVDPFDAFSKPSNDFEDLWSSKVVGPTKIPASSSTFDTAFASSNDNWAAAFGGNTTSNGFDNNASINDQSTIITSPVFDPFSNAATANFESTPTTSSTTNPAVTDANWAAFDDEPVVTGNNQIKPTASSSSSGSIRNAVQFFDQQIKLNSPPTASPSSRPSIPNKPDSLKASPSANSGFNQSSTPNNTSSSNVVKYCCMFQFDASRDDELSINVGDVINVNLSVKTDEGWIWGESRGRTGVFPIAFAAPASELGAIHEDPSLATTGNMLMNNTTSPIGGLIQQSPVTPMKTSQSVPELSTTIKNYYLSIYAYVSNEPGDLNFREFEIINVIDRTEDWLTGQIVGSGQGGNNPLRHGIFPSNFVIKFPFPIEYIGKYTISMATETYVASDGTQLTLDPSENQLVAIKRISDDQKFLFGESIDLTSGAMRRGWFPVGMATPLIDSGTAPIYVPNTSLDETSTNNTLNDSTTNTSAAATASAVVTPPAPTSSSSSSSLLKTVSEPSSNAVVVVESTNITSVIKSAAREDTSNVNASTAPITNRQSLASSSINTPTSSTSNNNQYVNVIKPTETTTAPAKSVVEASVSAVNATAAVSSPSEVVKQDGDQQISAGGSSNNYIDRVVALYEFKPDESTPGAIGFPKDAVINILDKPSDWWFGEYNGQVGILPYNYVKSILKTEQVTKRTTTTKSRSLSLSTSVLSNSGIGSGVASRNTCHNNNNNNSNSILLVDSTDLSTSSSDNIYMNCDLLMGGSANTLHYHNHHLIDDTVADRSSLNEVSSDLENQLDNSLSSGGGISATLSQTDLAMTSMNPPMVVKSKHHKLCMNIVNEIVQTERNYLKSLKLMIDLYKNPLQQMRILTKTEIDAIFANIDEIYYINSKLFSALNRRLDDSRHTDQLPKIGDIFLSHLPKMSVYAVFVSANRVGEEMLYEKIKSSAEFNSMISKSFAAESAEFLLKKLLLLPMQRLMQYSLLVEKLIKNSDNSDSQQQEYENLKMTQKGLVDLIQSINNEVGKKDELEKLEWLDERVNLKGLEFKFRSQTNLMGTRRLIYYGPLVKDSGKDLYAFLFNDSLLMVEASESLQNEIFKKRNSGSKFQLLNLYKLPIILDNITIAQSKPSHTGSDCHFHVLCGEKEYSFRTTNPILKNEWVKQLQRSIEAYKQKKRSVSQSLSAYNLSQKNPVGRILIVIMEAQDLLQDGHERNVFCEASVGMQKFTTHSIDSGNPKWNTSMQFQFYDLSKDVLAVNMLDRKVYRPNTFLGKLEFKILHIYREQMKENQESSGGSGSGQPFTRVYRMSGVQTGKLMLKINIIVYKQT